MKKKNMMMMMMCTSDKNASDELHNYTNDKNPRSDSEKVENFL